MKCDVNDLSPKQLNLLIAQAQEYAYMEHGGCIHIYLFDEDNEYGEGSWYIFNPIEDWSDAGELLEMYKPYISPTKNGVVVEILDEISSVKSKLGIKYATAKHPDNIRLALCRAIVAYHYGYTVEI